MHVKSTPDHATEPVLGAHAAPSADVGAQDEYDSYSQGFCDFLNDAPTVFHAVDHYVRLLDAAGYVYLSEREDWSKKVKPGGKYYVTRNYTSLIAFTVGGKYWPGHGVALIGSHIDALTLKVKPVSKASNVGFLQLKVAPYAVSTFLPLSHALLPHARL